MIRHSNFVADFLGVTRTKKASPRKVDSPRWIIVENEKGEKILARRDDSEKSEKKIASRYQDFDDYILLIYPKEYAKKYVSDTNSNKINLDKAAKFIANSLRSKIANLSTLKNNELVEISKIVYAKVDTKEIAEHAEKEGYRTKSEDSFSKAFLNSLEKSKNNEFLTSFEKKLSFAVNNTTNPYKFIEDTFIHAGVNKEVVLASISKLISNKRVSTRDIDLTILDKFLSANKEITSDYKEGYNHGFSGKKISSTNSDWVRGYVFGLEKSFEFEDRT